MALKIGVIGDFDSNKSSHNATNAGLTHAAHALAADLDVQWLPTEQLEDKIDDSDLEAFDAFWCSPGSPYNSLDGALKAIRFARENNWPFIGTWGGFQHALLEYARNVLGIADAHHKEANPDSAVAFISPLSCALIGEQRTVWIAPDTMVGSVYEKGKVVEQFNCSYGLNEAFRNRLGNSAFKISGVDDQNEVRIVELTDHRFFVATLYMPQLSSTQQAPHPLIVSFLKAAVRFKRNRQQMMDE